MEIIYPYLKSDNDIYLKTEEAYIKHFQIISIDFLLDDKNKLWLLEMNQTPNFFTKFQSQSLQKPAKRQNSQTSLIEVSEVECEVKKRVIFEAITMSRLKQTTIDGLMKFGTCYERVHVEPDEDALMSKVAQIFAGLQKHQRKLALSRTSWMNLAKLKGMATNHFPKTSYDLMYVKMKEKHGQMDLGTFFTAL